MAAALRIPLFYAITALFVHNNKNYRFTIPRYDIFKSENV